MIAVPSGRDLLGAASGVGSTRNAQVTYPALPNGEAIVFLHWFHIFDPEKMSAGEYIPFRIRDSVTPDESVNAYTYPGGGVRWWAEHTGTSKYGDPVMFTRGGEFFHAFVFDRDNGVMEVWRDGRLMMQNPLSQDPDLSGTNWVYFNTAGGAIDCQMHHWRASLLTLEAGAVPTEGQWGDWLRGMMDPQTPLHAKIRERVGTRYSDWNWGEGVEGSATIIDHGDSGQNMTWQGGLDCDNVRVPRRVPLPSVRRSWYSCIPGTTAGTGIDDLGFVGGKPVIARVLFPPSHIVPGGGAHSMASITGNSSDDFLYWRQTSTPALAAYAKAAGGLAPLQALFQDQYEWWGDLYFICEGTNVKLILNGHHIGDLTIDAAIDFEGANSVCGFNGNGPCIRQAYWEVDEVPDELEDEIIACLRNPEIDPLCLGDPLLDFPWRSDLFPLGTETSLANQGTAPGVSMGLSGQFQNITKRMITGYDP